jgi:hypothetical protein
LILVNAKHVAITLSGGTIAKKRIAKTLPRRLFRYSLRTLLVFVTLAALSLGWKVNQTRNEQRAVAAIEAAGGLVRYDWMDDYYQAEVAKGPVHWSAIYGGRDSRRWSTLRQWFGDEYFEHVIAVTVFGSDLDDHDDNDKRWMGGLLDLPKLITLDIDDIPINDDDLQHVKDLTALRSLSLSGAAVTDAGVIQLENLTNLEWLDLTSTSVSDESVDIFIRFSQLQHLWLNDTQVTPSGAEKIREALPHCRVFSSSD